MKPENNNDNAKLMDADPKLNSLNTKQTEPMAKITHDIGEEIEQKHGSIPLLKIAVSSLHNLLVEKGIVTEAEIEEGFAEMAKIAEEYFIP